MKVSAELREKIEHFRVALDLFVERILEDRKPENVLHGISKIKLS